MRFPVYDRDISQTVHFIVVLIYTTTQIGYILADPAYAQDKEKGGEK